MQQLKIYQTKEFKIAIIVIILIAFVVYIINKIPPSLTGGTKSFLGYQNQNGQLIPVQGQYNPQPLTDRIRADIYNKVGLRDWTAYEELASLDDARFFMVCEDWNKRYYNEDKESLRKAMEGETYWGASVIKTVFSKMDRLNIR
jgi:hypothetical protein